VFGLNFSHFPQHEWSVILVFCGPQPVDILPVPRGAQQFVHVGLEGRVAPGLDLPDHLAEPGFGNVRVEAGRGEGRTQLDPAFDPLESFCLFRREGPIAPAAMGASRFDPLVVTP
jgi:hypothetical protein